MNNIYTINFLSPAIVEKRVFERREGIYVTGSLETVTLGLAIRRRVINPGDDVEAMAEYLVLVLVLVLMVQNVNY